MGHGAGNILFFTGMVMSTVNASLMGVMNSIIMKKYTTIGISKSLRDSLASIGKKDQSFEDILQMLLSKWNEENG